MQAARETVRGGKLTYLSPCSDTSEWQAGRGAAGDTTRVPCSRCKDPACHCGMQVPGRLDVTIFLLRAFHPVVPGILEALHLPGPGMLRLTSIAAARCRRGL